MTPSKVLEDMGIATERDLQACDYATLVAMGIELEQLSQDDKNAISLGRGGSNYTDVLLPLRRDAYQRRADAMRAAGQVPEWLEVFCRVMAERFGPVGRVWANELPWLELFMVAMYGEAPEYWPDGTEKSFQDGSAVPLGLTERDRAAAMGWLNGRRPWPNGTGPVA